MSDVNMMTSLKALLFSSASTQSSAVSGAQPATEGQNFAALFGAAGAKAEATPDAALPLPLPQVAGGEVLATQGAPAPQIATVPLGTAQLLDALQARAPLPSTAVAQATVSDPVPIPAVPIPTTSAATAETPEAAPAEQPVIVPPLMAAVVPVEESVITPAKVAPKAEAVAQPVPPKPEAVEAKAEPDAQDEGEDDDAQTAEADPAPQSVALAVPAASPVIVPPVTVPPVTVLPVTVPPVAVATQQADAPRAKGEQPVSAPSIAQAQASPAVEVGPVALPSAGEAVPVATFPPVKTDPAALADATLPVPPARGADGTAGAPVEPQQAPAALATSAPIAAGPVVDQPELPVDSSAAAPSVESAKAKPVKSEALSLLQLVREQFGQRSATAAPRAEAIASHAKADRPTERADAAPLPVPASDQPSAISQPTAAPAPQTGVQASATTQPTVDLSASLGAQVVDMGVSGQWIDGLARDIAGLSANGAQGRFQINADKLGPVQVDIRQGSDGAAVNLTVASEAAEMALQQDSDRLRLDAGLSAVRISEVKIERAPHVAEAARADSANQQQSSSQNANGWANNGQNMAQSQGQAQGQGRWRPQENSAFSSKNSGDPAVLNHDDTRRAGNDAVRARYA